MRFSAEPPLFKYLYDKARLEGTAISGTFELTQRCNFNCKMCYVHEANASPDALTAEQWLDLGRQAQKAGTVFLLLTGGEPLIRDDFDEIYEGLIKMGFLISINSNGSLIDKHIHIFKKYPPEKFNISIYGSDEKTYKSLCGVNKLERVLSNIDLLKENNIDVNISMVATPYNAHCFKEIIDICDERDIVIKPTAYTYPPIRLGKTENEARFAPKIAARYLLDIEKYLYDDDFYMKRRNRFATCGGNKPTTTEMRCRAGRSTYWITSEGIMRPCGMMPDNDTYPLEVGFDEAWTQTKINTDAIRTPKECLECKHAGSCIVCAAMCKAETGSYDKVPKYVCKMMETVHNLAKKEMDAEVENK